MQDKTIVIVGLQSWTSSIGSNCKNLAIEFSKKNKVLFVNRATDRKSVLISSVKGKYGFKLPLFNIGSPKIQHVDSNLWVFEPSVILESFNFLPAPIFDFFNRLNAKRFANQIKHALSFLDFDREYILFNDNDFFRGQYLKEELKPSMMLYYLRDFLISQPYFKRHGKRLEISIMQKSDHVFTNSPMLSEYAKKFNLKVTDIGQGCDFKYFDSELSYETPAELIKLKGPVIGYVGSMVHFRLDIKMLEKICRNTPKWNWVFVGPEDNYFAKSVLHDLSNVFFIGPKNEDELAMYIQAFDVCINPQLINEITNVNYPRKVDEYLIMGKPVVSRNTEFMRTFLPFVYLYDTIEQFEECIELSLNQSHDADLKLERKNFAQTHSWENCVIKIYHQIEKKSTHE